MLADEIKTGESANTEFKVEVPKKSEKYIKSVVAFANTAGGKIILGVDDKTHEIVGNHLEKRQVPISECPEHPDLLMKQF